MTALGATDRIVLDTNIVRGLIDGEPGCLNVPRLQRLKGAHPVSIADGAFGELLWWLRKAHEMRPDLLRKVKPALERLDPLLDQEFPITPSGSQRLAMIGLIPWPARSRAGDSNLYNAYWRHLKRVKDCHSLTKKEIKFRDTRGQIVTTPPPVPDQNLKASQDEWWSDVIELPTGQELKNEAEELMVRRRREHVARKLGIDPLTPALERIDLHSHFIVQRQREASYDSFKRPETPEVE